MQCGSAVARLNRGPQLFVADKDDLTIQHQVQQPNAVRTVRTYQSRFLVANLSATPSLNSTCTP